MAQDILFGSDGDLLIENGDLVVGDSRYQHVQGLLLAHKGHYKFDPLAGVGIERFLNDEIQETELMREIRTELERDGFAVAVLYIQEDGKLKIDGNYKDRN